MQQQKFLKRSASTTGDDLDPDGSYDGPPSAKMQHNGGGGGSNNNGTENLTKFSVEIVQQLEFTTSTANSQPQQISTNVTVKALTNTSVKNESNNNSGGGGNNNNSNSNNNSNRTKSPSLHDLGHLVECKQEPDHDFADLDQCAAALEKDVAANGNFPGLSDLIGDELNGDLLMSDLSDFQSEYLDFEEKPNMGMDIKQEQETMMMKQHQQQQQNLHHHNQHSQGGDGLPPGLMDAMGMKAAHHNSMMGNGGVGMNPNMMGQQFGGGPNANVFNNNNSNANNDPMNKARLPFGAGGPGGPGNVMMNGGGGGGGAGANPMAEMSPAAQTLKHMAEQHQHKNAMGGFPRPPMHPQQGQQQGQQGRPGGVVPGSNSNSGFMDQFGQFCADSGQQQRGFPGTENIKQEMMYSPQNEFEMKMKMSGQMGGGQKMPPFNKGPGPQQQQQQQGQNGGGGASGVGQQPFSPYGSPGTMSNHGSPAAGGPGGFMGNRGTGGGAGGPQAAGPPRPASGGHPQQQQQQQTLQMKQSQQLHITQQGMGHGLQVSRGGG